MKYTYAYKTSDGARHDATMEAAFAGYAKDELSAEKNETSPDAWESKNEALRRLGLRTIPNPNE